MVEIDLDALSTDRHSYTVTDDDDDDPILLDLYGVEAQLRVSRAAA